MKKRRKSDDYLSKKRGKRALKEARRAGQRRERIEARNEQRKAAMLEALESFKQKLIEDWEKKFE